MLNRLLYASRSIDAMDDRLIQTVLEQSRASNPEFGITGILCVDPSRQLFLQALEGSRAAVNQLYANIVRDPRHADVTLLHYGEVDARSFSGWRMGSIDLGKANPSTILRFSETAHFDPLTTPGNAALALIEELIGSAPAGSANG